LEYTEIDHAKKGIAHKKNLDKRFFEEKGRALRRAKKRGFYFYVELNVCKIAG